jgi:hypothetical protein
MAKVMVDVENEVDSSLCQAFHIQKSIDRPKPIMFKAQIRKFTARPSTHRRMH